MTDDTRDLRQRCPDCGYEMTPYGSTDILECRACGASMRARADDDTRERAAMWDHIADEIVPRMGDEDDGEEDPSFLVVRFVNKQINRAEAAERRVWEDARRIDGIRQFHHQITAPWPPGAQACGYCLTRTGYQTWPCETVRALDGENQ